MYQVQYKKSATKALSKLPRKTARQFMSAFEQIANENTHNFDIKKLHNREGFRLRIGSYRALYRVLNDVLIIEVVRSENSITSGS